MKFGNGFFLYEKPFFPLFLSDSTKIIVPVTYETLATFFALYLHKYNVRFWPNMVVNGCENIGHV